MARTQEASIEGIVEMLLQALGPGDIRTVSFLSDRGEGAVQRLVHAVLIDKSLSTQVTNHALRLSPMCSSPVIVGDVVEVLRTRARSAFAAGIALRKARDKAAVGDIRAILLDMTVPPECRAGAAVALSGLPDDATKKVLIQALLAPEQDAMAIVHIIGSLSSIQVFAGARDAAKDIGRFLKSESPDVRYSALVALGNIRATDMIEEILPLESDRGLTASGHSVGSEARRVTRLLRNA
jgi:HEAT repeat protein